MARPLLQMERPDEARPPDDDMLRVLQSGWHEDWGASDKANIHLYSPAFYEDVSLVEIELEDASPAHARLFFLCHEGSLFRLNGTSPPIHDVNGRTCPLLRGNTVLDYLAFFCFFVRGDEGPFLIVDRPNGRYVPNIPDGDALLAAFRSPRIWGQDENGDWQVSALVYYSNALFFADFLVQLGGMINMKRDASILADLPNSVDAPLEAWRRDS